MNRKTLALTAAIFSSLCGSLIASQEGIRWEELSIQAAQRQAAQTRRLVLVHFWSPNCGPCQKMERLVFSRPDVAVAVETYYVPVKINADQFPYTARQYGITALPTDLVLSPNGQVIRRFQGAVPADQYIAQLHQLAREVQLVASSNVSSPAPAGSAQGMQPPPPTQAEMNPSFTRNYEGSYWESLQTSRSPQNPPAWAGPPVDSSTLSSGYAAQVGPTPTPPDRAPSRATPAQSDIPGPGVDPLRSAPLAERSMSPPLLSGRSSSPGGPVPSGSPPNPSPRNTPPRGDMASRGGSFPNGPGGSPSASLDNPPLAGGSSPRTPPFSPPNVPPGGGTPLSEPRGTTSGSGGAGPYGAVSPSDENVPDSWPPGLPPLALEGYCPVELVEKHRWVLGTHPWGVIHRGRTYMCAGPEEQKKFLANPDRYAPVLSGYDLVLSVERGLNVPGRREHGVFYRGRVYLFADETTLEAFRKNPRRYLEALSAPAGSETASRR